MHEDDILGKAYDARLMRRLQYIRSLATGAARTLSVLSYRRCSLSAWLTLRSRVHNPRAQLGTLR